ncbi:MAG: sodium/glutamate symporter, partial [Candidatus Eisenbacteria bacterium]
MGQDRRLTIDRIVLSFCALSLLLLIGQAVRTKVRWTQRLLLPASVLGGLIGLVVIQLMQRYAPGSEGFVSDATSGWSQLPSFLINIVFATLFLGIAIPPLRKIWRIAGPQLAFGQIVAWGQYAVGIGLTLFVLSRIYDIPAMFGAIIPVGFEGGHGTAAGLAPVFAAKGWPEGADLALGSATVGVVAGVVVGMALVNWAARKRYCKGAAEQCDKHAMSGSGIVPIDERTEAGKLTFRSESVETLAMHLAIVAVAILIGYVIKKGLTGFEGVWLTDPKNAILGSFPLFPLARVGGVILQKLMDR